MPTPEEIFDQPLGDHEGHDHGSGSPSSKTLSTEEALALLSKGPSVAADDDDPERMMRNVFGPHEQWDEAKPDDTEEQDALDKAAKLRAADEDAAKMEGHVGGGVDGCSPTEPMHAIEVELRSDDGPVVGAMIELRREGQDGVITLRTDGKGRVRFEGLLDADQHQVRAIGCGPWSLEGAEALPAGRKESTHKASWSAAAAAKGGKHVVAEGECLWTLATRHGLDPDALWESNPDLHSDQRTPNVLAPGDVVVLSEGEPVLEAVDVGTEVALHCTPAEAKAALVFQDDAGKARSGIDFMARIVAASGIEKTWSSKTNGDGGLDEAVPADAVTLEITLAPESGPETYHFRFAHLDPVSTVTGVQGRLFNLGFWCGDEAGEVGPLTKRALREFQKKYELTPSAEIDDATRSKLVELYTV